MKCNDVHFFTTIKIGLKTILDEVLEHSPAKNILRVFHERLLVLIKGSIYSNTPQKIQAENEKVLAVIAYSLLNWDKVSYEAEQWAAKRKKIAWQKLSHEDI